MTPVTLTLIEPVKHGHETITEVVLNPPRAADVIKLGMPWSEWIAPDGSVQTPENDEKLAAYLNRIFAAWDPVKGPVVLNLLSLTDIVAARAAVMGFFTSALATLAERSKAERKKALQ